MSPVRCRRAFHGRDVGTFLFTYASGTVVLYHIRTAVPVLDGPPYQPSADHRWPGAFLVVLQRSVIYLHRQSNLSVPLVLCAVCPSPLEARPMTFLASLRRDRNKKQLSDKHG